MKWLRLLACPSCGGALAQSGPPFRCSACDAEVPTLGNSPDFLATAPHAGDALEVDYDYEDTSARASGVRFEYRDRRRLVEQRIIEGDVARLGRPLAVLDIGGGDPFRSASSYHQRWKHLFSDCVVAEPSIPMVARSKADDAIGMIRASGEHLPFVPGSCDLALCLSTLDHVMDPRVVMAEALKALRPGGRLLMDLKNEAAWFKALTRLGGKRLGPLWRRLEDDHHPWRFSTHELAALLTDAGFTGVRVTDLHYYSELVPGRLRLGTRVDRAVAAGLSALDAVTRRIVPGRGGVMVITGFKPADAR